MSTLLLPRRELVVPRRRLERRELIDPRRQLLTSRRDPHWLRPRAMYPDGLGGVGASMGVPPGPVATFTQTPASGRSVGSIVFGSNPVVGHLLFFAGIWRAGAGLQHAPVDGETWTTLKSGQFQRTSSSEEQGFILSAATCSQTSTSRLLGGTNPSYSIMWEVTVLGGLILPADLVARTVSKDDQGAGSTFALGSLGGLDARQIAVGIWGFGNDLGVPTMTPGVWIADYFSNRDVATVGSNTVGSGGYPYGFFAHTTGAGAVVAATVVSNTSDKWGGAAVSTP